MIHRLRELARHLLVPAVETRPYLTLPALTLLTIEETVHDAARAVMQLVPLAMAH